MTARRIPPLPAALAAVLLLSALAAPLPAAAHEFWLVPEAFAVDPGDRLVARGIVGELLVGDEIGYFPEATVHLDLTLSDETVPLAGVPGQEPAVDAEPLGEGLHVLRFQSANYELSYPDFAKFEEFLDEWDHGWAREVHAANDFPRDNIREVYFRYAKSLIAVGDGAGRDRFLGMPLELVALDNPYVEPAPETIVIELRFLGEPLKDVSVKHIHRDPAGEVSITRLRSDEAGRVEVPLAPGFHLVNAVVLDTASPRMRLYLGATWQSLWASLTYGLD